MILSFLAGIGNAHPDFFLSAERGGIVIVDAPVLTDIVYGQQPLAQFIHPQVRAFYRGPADERLSAFTFHLN